MSEGVFVPGIDPGLKKWLQMRQANRDSRNNSNNDLELIPCKIRYKYSKYWNTKQNNICVPEIAADTVISLQHYETLLASQSPFGYVDCDCVRLAIAHRSSRLLQVLILCSGFTCNAVCDSVSQRTPLHMVCENGDLEKIEILLRAGSDPNITDAKGRTSLHVAIKPCSMFHKIEIIELLLKFGANSLIKDDNGLTALHVACISGQDNVVVLLLENISGQRCTSVLDNKSMLPLDHSNKSRLFFINKCSELCSRRQNHLMWSRVVARDFVESVFRLVEPQCNHCKRTVMLCSVMKKRDYRYWMYVHNKLSKELKNGKRNYV